MKPFQFIFLLWLRSHAFTVRTWQSVGDKLTIPEQNEVAQDVALTFSGGGSRAFIAAIGVLAALSKANRIDSINYIAGISGGSWATAAFTYSQLNVSDEVLLGKVVPPEAISLDVLNEMSPQCLRSFTNMNMSAVKQELRRTHREIDEYSLWVAAISKIYLEPAGLLRGTPFSWSPDSVARIKAANPSLANTPFLLPRSELTAAVPAATRPFPIIAWTLIGPSFNYPYTPVNRNYSFVESTPLSTGVLSTRRPYVSFTSLDASVGTANETVGGLMDSFAFSFPCPSSHRMDPSSQSDLIEIQPKCGSKETSKTPIESIPFLDIAAVAGASSYDAGTFAASNTSLEALLGRLPYWSVVAPEQASSPLQQSSRDPAPAREYLVSDGGGLQVDNLASLLQRKVKHVFLFCLTSVPLQPRSVWDPYSSEQLLSQRYIDFDIPSFFGVLPSDLDPISNATYDLSRSHFFSSTDFAPLASSLQEEQSRGGGVIVTQDLVTVENSFYGIPHGQRVKLTLYYLSRLWQWEDKLSDEMKSLVVPADHPENMANLIQEGPFAKFPNYPTYAADLNFQQSNLLADLVSWSVLNNIHHFE